MASKKNKTPAVQTVTVPDPPAFIKRAAQCEGNLIMLHHRLCFVLGKHAPGLSTLRDWSSGKTSPPLARWVDVSIAAGWVEKGAAK